MAEDRVILNTMVWNKIRDIDYTYTSLEHNNDIIMTVYLVHHTFQNSDNASLKTYDIKVYRNVT